MNAQKQMHNMSEHLWFGPARNNQNQHVLFTKNTGKKIGTPNGTLFMHHLKKRAKKFPLYSSKTLERNFHCTF